ncbi:hypothetical protein MASR2M16_08530 [Thauera terpenica]
MKAGGGDAAGERYQCIRPARANAVFYRIHAGRHGWHRNPNAEYIERTIVVSEIPQVVMEIPNRPLRVVRPCNHRIEDESVFQPQAHCALDKIAMAFVAKARMIR